MLFLYNSFWKESNLKDLRQFATDEFEYIYSRSARKQFSGLIITNEDKKGVEFYWFKTTDCDTTKVFIYVTRKGDDEPISSEITINL